MEELRNTILLIVLGISIVYMLQQRRRVLTGQVIEESLTGKEKILIWVLCIFNPIIAGAVFYYGWIKKLPVKARQANKISIIAFFISLIVLGAITASLVYYSGKKNAEYQKQFQQARELIKNNKFDEAQVILLALDKEIQTSGVYYNLALTYEAQQNLDEAEARLSKLLEIDPQYNQAKEYLSYIQSRIQLEDVLKLIDEGNVNEAKSRLLKLIEIEHPAIQVAARFHLAGIYAEEKNETEVIKQLEAVLQIDPSNKDAQRFLDQIKAAK